MAVLGLFDNSNTIIIGPLTTIVKKPDFFARLENDMFYRTDFTRQDNIVVIRDFELVA